MTKKTYNEKLHDSKDMPKIFRKTNRRGSKCTLIKPELIYPGNCCYVRYSLV